MLVMIVIMIVAQLVAETVLQPKTQMVAQVAGAGGRLVVASRAIAQGARGVARPSLLLHGVPVHSGLQTLAQATPAALVPSGLVHGAATGGRLAGIVATLPDGALEETGTAIAGVDAVVFP